MTVLDDPLQLATDAADFYAVAEADSYRRWQRSRGGADYEARRREEAWSRSEQELDLLRLDTDW